MNSTYLTIGKFLEITLSVHLSNFFNPPAKKKSYFIQNLFIKYEKVFVRSSNWAPGARLNHEPDRVQVYLRVHWLPGKVYLLLHAYDSSSLHGKHKVFDRLGSERGSKERVKDQILKSL